MRPLGVTWQSRAQPSGFRMDSRATENSVLPMKNVTLTLDEATLAAGKHYAQRRKTTLDSVVGDLLRNATLADRKAAAAEMVRLMNKYPGRSAGKRWTREELYDRPVLR